MVVCRFTLFALKNINAVIHFFFSYFFFFFGDFFLLDQDTSELRTGETTNGGLALIEWRSAPPHSCYSPFFFSLIFIFWIVYPLLF